MVLSPCYWKVFLLLGEPAGCGIAGRVHRLFLCRCGGKYTYSPLENSIFENNISHMFNVVKLLKIVSEFACLLSICMLS